MSFQIYSRVDDANATTLQSIEVSSAQPTTGALMQYTGSSWAPGPLCGTGIFQPTQGQTSVVCNGVAGKITLDAVTGGPSPSMPFTFTVTNNYIKSTDLLFVNVNFPPSKKQGPLQISIAAVSNGSFQLSLIGTWPAPILNIQVYFQILRPQ